MSSCQKETPQLLAFSNHSPSWSLDLSVLDISFHVNRIISVWYFLSGYFTETAVRGSSCNLCQAASLCGWVTLLGWRDHALFILHPLIGVLVAATFGSCELCSCEHGHRCVFGYPFSTEYLPRSGNAGRSMFKCLPHQLRHIAFSPTMYKGANFVDSSPMLVIISF